MDARNEKSADLDARSIIVRRTLDAPRALVFEAWTHPMHLQHWWGPTGFSITTSGFDFRPGGVWRFVMHGPDGRDYQNLITFEEITVPERIVYRHGGGDDVEPAQFTSTATFESDGNKTRLTLWLLFPSAAERDRVEREYHAVEGAQQTVGRLANYTSSWAVDRGLEKSITLERYLDAPPALVFEALTNPKHLAQWWGPKGFSNPVCEFDARPGGAILIHMEGPGGISHPMTGAVHEANPPERLVFTAVARDSAGQVLLESHTTISLCSEGKGTRIEVTARAKGVQDIARLMLAGMREGWSQSLEKLEELVVQMAKV